MLRADGVHVYFFTGFALLAECRDDRYRSGTTNLPSGPLQGGRNNNRRYGFMARHTESSSAASPSSARRTSPSVRVPARRPEASTTKRVIALPDNSLSLASAWRRVAVSDIICGVVFIGVVGPICGNVPAPRRAHCAVWLCSSAYILLRQHRT